VVRFSGASRSAVLPIGPSSRLCRIPYPRAVSRLRTPDRHCPVRALDVRTGGLLSNLATGI